MLDMMTRNFHWSIQTHKYKLIAQVTLPYCKLPLHEIQG